MGVPLKHQAAFSSFLLSLHTIGDEFCDICNKVVAQRVKNEPKATKQAEVNFQTQKYLNEALKSRNAYDRCIKQGNHLGALIHIIHSDASLQGAVKTFKGEGKELWKRLVTKVGIFTGLDTKARGISNSMVEAAKDISFKYQSSVTNMHHTLHGDMESCSDLVDALHRNRESCREMHNHIKAKQEALEQDARERQVATENAKKEQEQAEKEQKRDEVERRKKAEEEQKRVSKEQAKEEAPRESEFYGKGSSEDSGTESYRVYPKEREKEGEKIAYPSYASGEAELVPLTTAEREA